MAGETGRGGKAPPTHPPLSPLLSQPGCAPPHIHRPSHTLSPHLLSSSTRLTLDERFALARSVGAECIQDAELRSLLEKKPRPVAYDGFEPSGRMHIAQGVMKALNVNKLTRSGVTFKFWVADWFAQLNNKMGGDLKKIQAVGDYMVEIWKAVGMEGIGDKVLFLNASEEINARAGEYWTLVMDVARRNNLKRIIRCSQVRERKMRGGESESAETPTPAAARDRERVP